MKLLFVFTGTLPFTVETPEREPLGGTESCIAWLARQLAANGHDVTLIANLPPGTPPRILGVRHLPPEASSVAFYAAEDFEAVIAVASLWNAETLQRVAPRACHIAWLHMMPDQADMAPLHAASPHIDWLVCVSRTQREMIAYGGPTAVIGNGIAPAFENLFSSAEELGAAKQNRAAYTSMPFRGLSLLPDVIGRLATQTRFDIYSAMHTYRMEEGHYRGLYARIKSAPNTFYHGALPQPGLAAALKPAAFLAYPCIFTETYCIAALEAIAAGLKLVSTDRGALKETTMGFADLLPVTPRMQDDDIAPPYAALLKKNVTRFLAHPQDWAVERFEQSQAVVRQCSWRARAGEWEDFLAPRIAAKRGGGL